MTQPRERGAETDVRADPEPTVAPWGELHSLSMANEDYLEAIWRIMLEEDGAEAVRSVAVAELLDVSKASVNKALATLKDKGYVEQHRYGRVSLTEQGRAYAELLWKCHRMLRTFLEDELGVEPPTADAEACLMEHALSAETMRRWTRHLEGQGMVVKDFTDDSVHGASVHE